MPAPEVYGAGIWQGQGIILAVYRLGPIDAAGINHPVYVKAWPRLLHAVASIVIDPVFRPRPDAADKRKIHLA